MWIPYDLALSCVTVEALIDGFWLGEVSAGWIWSAYSLALAYQVTSAVSGSWQAACRLHCLITSTVHYSHFSTYIPMHS
jgi:hypothetical protein